MARSPFRLWARLTFLFQKEIWRLEHLEDRSARGRLYAVLRIVTTTLTGLEDNRAASRAAALSFSSLLGLGPLVAIAMLVAGFMLDQQDPNLAANTLNRLITFIAPQIALSQQSVGGAPKNDIVSVTAATDAPAPVDVNPELVDMINGFIDGSRNGAAGAIGALTLIVIVLQLFTSVETSFNEIWGVRRGRSWLLRIVFYWTILTLGAVLFFAAVTGLSAGAFFNAFAERLPFGEQVVALLQWLLPAGSILVLVAILTLFYRTIPNTKVFWRAAFIGALVVTLLILLNNFLAFVYFRRVVQTRSLYGSLGILPILMLGLYVFWFFVLLGGHVSYAVQNAHYRNSQAAWNNLAESMRERLSLVAMLTICRRFANCLPPPTASQLSGMLKVPTQLMNECLNRLVKMNLVSPSPPEAGEAATDFRFQPARPLGRITLREFKTLDDAFGDDPQGPVLANVDPLVERYDATLDQATRGEFFDKSIETLLNETPIDASRPPFAFDARKG